MLDIGSVLSQKFRSKSTNSHWILKLYYNDESDFIGLSDSTQTIGGITYHGLATWGSYTQSADLLNFSASQGVFSVVITNTDTAILGHRFSDFFSTKAFVNRKWELYIESDGVVSTDTIGQGVISSDITHDDITITFRLLHKEYDLSIPVAAVDSNLAPEANLTAAIPYAYGTTKPTNLNTSINLDRLTIRGMFPAVINNRQGVTALPDVKELGELNTRWCAMKDGDNFAFCLPANTSVDSSSDPTITITGTDYRIPLNLTSIFDPLALSTNRANAIDKDLTTVATFVSQVDGNSATYDISAEGINGDGTITDVYISTIITAETSPHTSFADLSYSFDGASYDGTSGDLLSVGTISNRNLNIGSGNKNYPATHGRFRLTVTGDTAFVEQSSMTTQEITAELQVAPKDTFAHSRGYITTIIPGKKAINFSHEVDTSTYNGGTNYGTNIDPSSETIEYTRRAVPDKIIRKEWKLNAPANLEYIYYAGTGRLYGAWISSGRSNGYSAATVIDNPIYQAESLIRDEAGFTNVDATTFDESGNTTDGFIGDVFDLGVSSIYTAWSQPQFTTLFSELNRLGSQTGTFYFISGSGDFKSKTRRRSADYDSADLVVLYSDIFPITSFKTSINDVRNQITTSYLPNYSTDHLTEITSEVSDGTSQGTSVNGYGEVLIYEDSCPYILDSDTAEGINSYTLDLRKDQSRVIQFKSSSPRYQVLEVGDTVSLKDWPSDYKVLGVEVAEDDIWMCNSITKTGPDFVRIQVMEVSN